MYTPRKPGRSSIIRSIATSASRLVRMYPAGTTGRVQSSAEMYTNARGPSASAVGVDSRNASHTRNAAGKHAGQVSNPSMRHESPLPSINMRTNARDTDAPVSRLTTS